MTRNVLFVPKSELLDHFRSNARRDLKVVTPAILTEELFRKLVERGKNPKREVAMDGDVWRHSWDDEPNNVCESSEFVCDLGGKESRGMFALAFAVVGSLEERHVHNRHVEIYFSEHELRAKYRLPGEDDWRDSPPEMADGGLVVFGPGVSHKMRTGGLTLVVEVPSVERDRDQVRA